MIEAVLKLFDGRTFFMHRKYVYSNGKLLITTRALSKDELPDELISNYSLDENRNLSLSTVPTVTIASVPDNTEYEFELNVGVAELIEQIINLNDVSKITFNKTTILIEGVEVCSLLDKCIILNPSTRGAEKILCSLWHNTNTYQAERGIGISIYSLTYYVVKLMHIYLKALKFNDISILPISSCSKTIEDILLLEPCRFETPLKVTDLREALIKDYYINLIITHCILIELSQLGINTSTLKEMIIGV